MTVGEQHGIETSDAVRQHLLSEVRTRVDENGHPSLDINVDGRAQSAIARVRRPAHGARATDHGNPRRSAGAEEGNPRRKGHPLAALRAQGRMMRDVGSASDASDEAFWAST